MIDPAAPILGIVHSTPTAQVPPRACDCHVHVFGPATRFPFDPDRVYTPGDASVDELIGMHRRIAIERTVIVNPSPYGTDNACTLAALRVLGDRGRAVAVIGSHDDAGRLAELHAAGVRGVRLNLKTTGVSDPSVARAMLSDVAARVAPLGWHVQIFTSLPVIEALHRDLSSLPVPVVIDHFGSADPAAGFSQPGWREFVALVENGHAYVKLSASHRISKAPSHADVAPLARALIAANRERMLWGSDWPHTGGGARGKAFAHAIEPFEPIDNGPAIDRLASWAGDDATFAAILVDNPARLYDFAD